MTKRLLNSLAASIIAAMIALVLLSYAPDLQFDKINGHWVRHTPITSVLAQLQYPLGPYANLGFTNGPSVTVASTIPAFQMVGLTTANSAGAIALTTDTATNLCNLFPFVGSQTTGASNFAWDWYIKQTGAGSTTMVAGTGVTVIGSGSVATVSVRHMKIQLVNCPPVGLSSPTPAVNAYSLETAAF